MIDIHTHVNFHGKTVDDLVKYMDNLGVEKSWVLAWEAIDSRKYEYFTHMPTADVVEACRKYPDRLIPFCGTDPREERAIEKVKDWAKKGCRGYGEHKVRIRIDNPYSKAIYKVCGELGMPVLVHMQDQVAGRTDWFNTDMEGLGRILREFPKTIFIGHGPGFWSAISNDLDDRKVLYPEGKIKLGGKVEELLEKNPNLCADISAESGLNALKRDISYTKSFLTRFSKRILYGTDSIFDSSHLDLLKSLEIETEVLEDITRNNARKIIP